MKYAKLCLLILLVLTLNFSVVAALPQRIVSGMPSITEMLYALDLGERVVGVTTNCNYPPEALKKEKIGGFFLNLEKIVSLKPDLIIMVEDTQQKDIKRFRDFGLNVYTINPKSVKGVMKNLLDLGEVTGKEAKAEEVVKEMKIRIKQVEQRIKTHQPGLLEIIRNWGQGRKNNKALVIVGLNPLIVAGGGTFIDDIIRHAGLVNIAGEARGAYPQYSFEKLVQEDPDYLIVIEGLVKQAELKNDRRWQSLAAVKNDRILFINADIISRPGPRVVEAIEAIADYIYEEKN